MDTAWEYVGKGEKEKKRQSEAIDKLFINGSEIKVLKHLNQR